MARSKRGGWTACAAVDDVAQTNNIVQRLNDFSSIAHIPRMGLKVVPMIAAFSNLHTVNLSGADDEIISAIAALLHPPIAHISFCELPCSFARRFYIPECMYQSELRICSWIVVQFAGSKTKFNKAIKQSVEHLKNIQYSQSIRGDRSRRVCTHWICRGIRSQMSRGSGN
ncbi:unnamed protein product [Triticum turgidum subsp. durum]|uniref:Uncharacterized protein n=1 Tax=Triticum turgidum subsp. durum TaxID=4567 RepID=A0A9R1BZ67_TRITD|nr:unnamed protein product [Triticum turgidum subsp. durum]